VCAALFGCALWFAWTPAAPRRVSLVRDTEGCRLGLASEKLAPCACAETPLAVRDVLGLPAPLNALAAAELERISGLGPVRAAAIERERLRAGPYRSLEELHERVSGIGPKTVDRIRSRLFASGPDPACGGVGSES
jgi:competence ComEA-like helix-hairpin-helix protein